MEIKLAMTPDVPDINGRIYPSDVVRKAIEDYNNRDVKIGTLNYGETAEIPLDKRAFEITTITEKPDGYYAEIELLDSLEGRAVKSIIENSDDVRLGSLGLGELNENKIENLEIIYFIVRPISDFIK